MPQYTIEDSKTGRSLTVEGDSPPSQQDADELFASQPAESKDSILKSAGVGLASSAGGVGGAWLGAEGAMAAAVTPAAYATAINPVLGGAIEVGAGLVGAIVGSTAGQWVQDKVLTDRIKKVIQKAHEDNPIASDVGSLVGGAVAFKPGLNANGWADLISGRFGTKAAQKAAVGLGLGAGVGIASPLVQGQKPTGEDVVMSILMASLLGESRGGKLRIGTERMEAVREQAAKIAKTLTPEEKAHMRAVAQTGLDPKDHELIANAAQGKNVYILKPDEEASVLGKTTDKDVDKAADTTVDDVFNPQPPEAKKEITLSKDEAAPGGHEKVQAIADKYNLSWDEAVEVLAKNRERLGIAKDVAHDELSEEEQLAKEIEEEERQPIKGEHIRAMDEAGLSKKEMANIRNVGEMNKAIELAKSKKAVSDSIAQTEAGGKPTAKEAAPKLAEPEKAKADPVDEMYAQLDKAENEQDVFKVVDHPDVAKLPAEQQAGLKMRGKEVREKLVAEKAIQDAIDSENNFDPNNAPFAETRKKDLEADELTKAARDGAVASWIGGRVVLFPRNLSAKIQGMRRTGFSDAYIQNTLKALLAHEEIHGATDAVHLDTGRDIAAEYYGELSGLERWAIETVYPSGRSRKSWMSSSAYAHYMGMEAIRMRMQDILRMTPDEISELAGTDRLKLDVIYGLQKVVRGIRENLLNRNAKGRALAMVKEIEIKLNLAETIARAKTAGIQQNAESRYPESRLIKGFYTKERAESHRDELVKQNPEKQYYIRAEGAWWTLNERTPPLITQNAETRMNPDDLRDREAEAMEDSAKEYLASGDQQTHDELMDRAKWLRQRGSEQMGNFAETRHPEYIGTAPVFTKKDGTKVGGFRMFNIKEPIYDKATGEMLHSEDSTVSEDTLKRHGVFIPGDQNAETRQDKFGFDESFEPKPLTPEQQVDAERIKILSQRLDKLNGKPMKTTADHAAIRNLEDQLGQGFMPFAETRHGEFNFEDERKNLPRKTLVDKQPDLFPKGEIGVKKTITKADKKRADLEMRQSIVIDQRRKEVARAAGEGDFTVESLLTTTASEVEANVDEVVNKIVDRRIAALTGQGGKPSSLEHSMKEFLRAFSRATGIPKGHLQILGQQAFWKKIDSLSGEQVDTLANFELSAGKDKLAAMQRAMGGLQISGTMDKFPEGALEDIEEPPRKLTDSQFRAAWSKMSEEDKARIVQAQSIAEAPTGEKFVKGMTHEPPAATVRKQDSDFVRAETQKQINRKASLYFKFIEPLLRETDFQRAVAPEDIQFAGHTDADGHHTGGVETFYASSQKDPVALAKELLSGWQRNTADPKTATQRLVVLQSKTSPEVFMVDIYKRGNDAYILDPLEPNKEHAPLSEVLKRYDVRHSILLDAPVVKFKQKFADYQDFKARFFDEAQQRLMKAESYAQEPMSMEEAIQNSPMGMRITDELGHEVDASDPEAEGKVQSMRNIELEQLRQETEKLEHSREAEGEDIPYGQILKNKSRIAELEKPAEITKVASSMGTKVRKGEGAFMQGPAAGKGRGILGIGRGGIETSKPMTEQETGSLYDFLTTELKGKPASTEDVEAILMGSKHTNNPSVVNAIGKYGKQAFKDFWENARQYIRDQKAKGNKSVAIEPKLEGYRLLHESARRLFRALQSSPDKESFVRNIMRAVNGPPKVEVKETGEIAPTGRELTYGPYQYPKTGMERAKQLAGTSQTPAGKPVFSSNRPPANVPDRPAPPIPQATTTPREKEYLAPEDAQALKDALREPANKEWKDILGSEPFDFAKVDNMWDELVKSPFKPVSYFSTFQVRLQTPPAGARTLPEAGRPEVPQFAETRLAEGMERAKVAIHAWQSGRANKDTLSRGADAATTTAANMAIKAANAIRTVFGAEPNKLVSPKAYADYKLKMAALKAFVSSKAVSVTYDYSPEAIARLKEIAETDDRFKLIKSLKEKNVTQTKILMKKILEDGSDIGQQDKEFMKDLEVQLNTSLVSEDQLFGIGAMYSREVRRSVESQLVNEGVLNHRNAKYDFDASQLHRIDGFAGQVKSGIEQAKKLQTSPHVTDRRIGRQWEEYANGLMKELDYAKDNWKDPQMQKAAMAYIKEMSDQYDIEKASGSEVRYDDAHVPGRYNADAFNNDYILEGHRVLGRRYGLPKTMANYYEAVAAGPYMAMTTDLSGLLEHRVRAGLNRVNTAQWKESWKNLKDEHADAPVAVGLRKVGNSYVPDTPKGVDGSRYKVVGEEGKDPEMAVLVGYDRLYRQLTRPSAVMDWAPSRLALQSFQFLKHSLLMGDFFHLFRVGYYAAAINGLGGVKQGLYKPGWAALEFRESQLDDAVKSGMIHQAAADWARGRVPFNMKGNKGAISRIALASELQKNGLNVGQIMDALYRDLASHMPLLGEPNKQYNRFLFDKWTRGLMARSALQEFERIQTANPEVDSKEILKTVARDMNNFFGSIGRQGWIKSRTFQDLSRMVFLAPQWAEGLVKKDFAIPYKFVTGINNGGAKKLLTGQESMGRGIARGMLMMAAMTQVASLIIKGKPTWENEDKEHKFDAEVEPGVFVSPLAVYNEILHDLVRYSETKPKVWDAISQIGENKMGFYTRAALIAATDKSPTGEYQTTSLGVMKEIGKSIIPAPITLRGPVMMAKHMMQGQYNPQDVRSTWAITGIKAEVGRPVVSRVQSAAEKFVRENHLKADMEVFTPTDEPSYQKLRRALENNDTQGAQSMYQELLKSHRQPQIAQAMRMWENRPFTGSHKNEVLWLHSLSDEDRAQYQQAIVYRRGLYQKWVDFFISQRA